MIIVMFIVHEIHMEKAIPSSDNQILCRARLSIRQAEPKFNFWFVKSIRNVLAFTLYLRRNYEVYRCCTRQTIHYYY